MLLPVYRSGYVVAIKGPTSKYCGYLDREMTEGEMLGVTPDPPS